MKMHTEYKLGEFLTHIGEANIDLMNKAKASLTNDAPETVVTIYETPDLISYCGAGENTTVRVNCKSSENCWECEARNSQWPDWGGAFKVVAKSYKLVLLTSGAFQLQTA